MNFKRRLAILVSVIFALTVVFYTAAVRPKLKSITRLTNQKQVLVQSVSQLERELELMPPVSESEQKLWSAIDSRMASVLIRKSEIPKLFADIGRIAGDHNLTVAGIENSEEPQVEEKEIQMRTDARTIQRNQAKPSSEEDELTVGAIRYRPYGVELQLQGDYNQLLGFLTSMSKSMTPCLIKEISGSGSAQNPEYLMTISVPLIFSSAASETSSIRVSVSPETAAKYRLDALAEPLSSLTTIIDRNPFPNVKINGPKREIADLKVSVITERNGRYIAVVNDQFISVGDQIEGLVVVEITPDTVVFGYSSDRSDVEKQ